MVAMVSLITDSGIQLLGLVIARGASDLARA
jgi:hypothetical protein